MQIFIKKVLKGIFLYSFSLYIISSAVALFAATEKINSYSVNINIKTNGVINVRETIEYTFPEERHGIFRNVPYTKENLENKNLIMDIKNIQVSLDKNINVPYTISKESGYVKLKIGDPKTTISGLHTYVISFDVYGALTYFDDHDELYWNAIGTEWPVQVSNANIIVTFEPYLEKRDLQVKCFTGYTGESSKSCLSLVTDTPSVAFQGERMLGVNEGVTIVVGFPKGKFEVLEPRKDILAIFAQLVFSLFIILWVIVAPIFVLIKYLKERKNVKNKQKIVAAWFSPPKNTYGTNYSPAQTGLLLDKKFSNKLITSTIISLAQRGVFKIKIEGKNNISFIRNSSDVTLDSFEKDIMDGIFSSTSNNVSKLNDLKKSTKFAKNITDFKTHLNQSIKKDKLFKYDLVTFDGLLIGLSIISLFTGNLLLSLFSFIFGRKSNPRTDFGIEKYSEAYSLKNFLVSQDAQMDFQAENQMYFEKLLPYASAFGVEDVWIKKFGNLDIQIPEWIDGDVGNLYALSTINHSIGGAISSSVNYSSRSSSGFSSGFSGGGHSGGGGGGGGGGSW